MSDLISRQAAIDAVRSYYDEQYALCDSIEELIEKLPSADTDLSDYSDRLWKNAYERGKAEGARIPSAEPEIIRCKECKHKPHPSDDYDYNNDDCGFEIIFPDYRCPCRCEDEYYNRIPDDDWYCGNAERRTDG